jgi:phage terminase large subunit
MAKKKGNEELFDTLFEDPIIKKDLEATRVFLENFESEKEIVINIGGGGSSKSYSIIQLLLYKFLTEKNKKILVVRKTMPSMRTSVIIPFYEIMESFGVRDRIKEDKVGMNFFFGSNLIHFNGLDNPEKIKSSSWNYMWFEEATDITENDFNTVRLYLRAPSVDKKPNQIFISFNPIDEFHWLKDKLVSNDAFKNDIKVIHSTYKDNPFLNDRSKKRYEELINQDINLYRIYALGEWGKLENLVYRNWESIPSMPINMKGGIILYGLDFGHNDPNVIVRSVVKDKDAFHEQILYKSGMTVSDLIAYMQTTIPKREWSKPMYADSQRPEVIKEIRNAGFNIKAAQKNIVAGIDFLKRMRHFIKEDSIDLIKEFRAYSWKTDKRGNIIDEPVDFMNHALDSMRYSLYSHLRTDGLYKVRWI